jgi:hypothetical protein
VRKTHSLLGALGLLLGAHGLLLGALGLLTIVISLTATCSQTNGIYADIESETATNVFTTTAIQKSSPGKVFRAGDKFYMAALSLYTRDKALTEGGSWTKITPPSDGSGATYCTEATAVNGVVYAAWLGEDASDAVGLYSYDAANQTWTKVSTDLDGLQISGLFSLNNTLVISTRETSGATTYYNVYYLAADGSTVTQTNLYKVIAATDTELKADACSKKPIVSAAYDGVNYWFICGVSLYCGTSLNSLAKLSDESGMPSGYGLKSLNWSSDLGRLLVATGSAMLPDSSGTAIGTTPGYVYARIGNAASGATWEKSPQITFATDDSAPYSNMTDTVVVPSASGLTLLVGAENSIQYNSGSNQYNTKGPAYGYGTFLPAADGSIAALSDYNAITSQLVCTYTNYETTLYDEAVTHLAYLPGADDTHMILFASTIQDGLWSTTYNISNGTWGGWTEE